MSMIRQVVLVREDLNLPRGLVAAQVAHIHANVFYRNLYERHKDEDLLFNVRQEIRKDMCEWLQSPYIFVHGVANVEVLNHLINRANEHDIPVEIWKDTIYLKVGDETVPFENIIVGAALGPCESDQIKMVIGTLDLLR